MRKIGNGKRPTRVEQALIDPVIAPPAPMATAVAPEKVKVVLKANHTRAGKTYQAGAEIEVPCAQAEWLKAQGKI